MHQTTAPALHWGILGRCSTTEPHPAPHWGILGTEPHPSPTLGVPGRCCTYKLHSQSSFTFSKLPRLALNSLCSSGFELSSHLPPYSQDTSPEADVQTTLTYCYKGPEHLLTHPRSLAAGNRQLPASSQLTGPPRGERRSE